MMLLLGAYFALGSVNFAAQRVQRDRVTSEALKKAKDALIAYAVSDLNRPGELPCPDVNDDGILALGEDFVGANCVALIGRLPWRTLGLPDLRDDAGERLWYALSNDFHANGSVALNSDTAFRAGNTSLQITGAHPASNLLAIVFSPGAALQRQGAAAVQNRSCTVGVNCDAAFKCTSAPASATPKCNPVNYLDVIAGEDNSDLDANRMYIAAAKSERFNDQLYPIHSDDVMRLVERRAGRELAQHLRDHYDAWQSPPAAASTTFANFKGFYPWAAPLSDPTTPAAGLSNTTNGLLPLDSSSVLWNAPTASLGLCAGANTAQIQCTAVSLLGLLTINGRVRNVGTAFIDPPTAANVNVTGVVLGQTISWTLDPANQWLDFNWSATIVGLAVVTVQAPQPSAWTTSSWLVTNTWNQNAFYAVSPGFALTGTDSCGGAPTNCLTVANTTAPNNDKQAVVLMTGRALTLASTPQAMRPVLPAPVPVAQFLEGANASPAPNLVFEHNARTAVFNDLPVVVRP